MDKEKLRQQLEQLHAELQQLDSPDGDERELLEKLSADVRAILARDEIQTDSDTGLTDRVQDTLARFEASHPEVTLRLRQVISELSYLGI
ncbi:MAG: DUF4404 family protein [Pyrinomonadaceae bacterium]